MTIAALVSALLASAPAAATLTPTPEPKVWALVRKVGTAAAYEVYLRRFPVHAHSDTALKAYVRLQGRPPVPAATVMAPWDGECHRLLSDHELRGIDSPEARAFLAARRTNRPADFQAFLAAYPKGACSAEAEGRIEMRETRSRSFKRIPGLGPLAPHRRNWVWKNEYDYPARAIRKRESGTVVAAWEIAEDGVVEGCHIVESSGSKLLDDTSCRLITSRIRYDPARDSTGARVRSADSMSVEWTLMPDGTPKPEGY